jgi:hypothetical protein
MERRLGGRVFREGYSIADMIYPVARHEWHRVDLTAFPNVALVTGSARARPWRGNGVPA